MNFFIDTNVPIGYTVPHDKWHENSVNFIENADEPIFWSTFVKKEYSDTLENIVDNIEIFLNSINKILKNNEKDFSNYTSFENFIIKQTSDCKLDIIKKTKLLEKFWEKNNFIDVISEELYIKFNQFSRDIRNVYYSRELVLENILFLHDCGLDNYLRYKNCATWLCNGGVHKSDCKVVLDAHDCGLIHDDLSFVSNDDELLELISKLGTSHLEIVEFRSCN